MHDIHNRRAGFTLVEAAVALLCLGLVLAPFLRFIGAVQQAHEAAARVAADLAWAQAPGQVLAAGGDANPQGGVLGSGPLADLGAGRSPSVRSRIAGGTRPFMPRVNVLGAGVYASGFRCAGLELGAGAVPETPILPDGPLEPVRLPPPDVAPAVGARVPLAALRSLGIPDGAVLDVAVKAPDWQQVGSLAAMAEVEGVMAAGVPSAVAELPAAAVATQASARAWTEFPGEGLPGAVAQRLSDGRRRWFVAEGGRFRRFDPSSVTRLTYVLESPPPVLRRGASLLPSGSAVDFRYADALAVRAGESLGLEVAPALADAFGQRWGAIRPSLSPGWSFGGSVVGSGWELGGLLAPGALGIWSDSQSLDVVVTSNLPGLGAGSGTFSFRRLQTALPAPTVVSPPYYLFGSVGTYARQVTVRAGESPEGVEARLEVDGVRSLGAELGVALP